MRAIADSRLEAEQRTPRMIEAAGDAHLGEGGGRVGQGQGGRGLGGGDAGEEVVLQPRPLHLPGAEEEKPAEGRDRGEKQGQAAIRLRM